MNFLAEGGTGFTAAEAHRLAKQASTGDEGIVQEALVNDVREEIKTAAEKGLFTLDYSVVGVRGIPMKKVKQILANILRRDHYSVQIRRTFIRISWVSSSTAIFI